MALILRKDLSSIRRRAHKIVDGGAEQTRAKFITLGAGMAMAYEQKKREADALLANPSIDSGEIPHVAAEAQIRGLTVMEMANDIVTAATRWTQASVVIERLRVSAKLAIDAATTPSEIDRAAEVDWSIVQMPPE